MEWFYWDKWSTLDGDGRVGIAVALGAVRASEVERSGTEQSEAAPLRSVSVTERSAVELKASKEPSGDHSDPQRRALHGARASAKCGCCGRREGTAQISIKL